jgi:hypothetical protein
MRILYFMIVAFLTILYREEADTAMIYGQEQLEILKRQAVMGQMYPTARSVMES